MPNRKFVATLSSIGAVAGCGLTSDHAGSSFVGSRVEAGGALADSLDPDQIASAQPPSEADIPGNKSEGVEPAAASRLGNTEVAGEGRDEDGDAGGTAGEGGSGGADGDGSGGADGGSGDAVWIGDARVCENSWEEAPGTADYTTFNNYLRSIGRKRRARVDREEGGSLRGSEAYAAMNLCEKARAIKPCFEKVTLRGDDWGARKFRAWAHRERINPVRAHLAIALQETRLGTFEDRCRRGVCYGIGMLQIISAFDDRGRSVASGAPEWDGITHNILTNIKYSARVLAVKIDFGASSLSQLAYYYNGNPSLQSYYARKVVEHYRELKRCRI